MVKRFENYVPMRTERRQHGQACSSCSQPIIDGELYWFDIPIGKSSLDFKVIPIIHKSCALVQLEDAKLEHLNNGLDLLS